MGESVRPVRRYFSKEAKSRLIREGRALDDDEGLPALTLHFHTSRFTYIATKWALWNRTASCRPTQVCFTLQRHSARRQTFACRAWWRQHTLKLDACASDYFRTRDLSAMSIFGRFSGTFDVAANEVPKTQEEVEKILAIVKVYYFPNGSLLCCCLLRRAIHGHTVCFLTAECA